jgi:hypothetical protein
VRHDNNNVAPLRLATIQILDAAIGQIDHYHQLYGDWSVQGMGLLRLYIRKLGRLHIWDDALRYPNVSMIHTHSWDLVSTIVAGSLTNIRYVEAVPGGPNGAPFRKQTIVCGYNTRTASPVVDTNLVPFPLETLLPGDLYRQRASEIHKTVARNGTVTIMERHEEGEGKADVFWPSDCTWGDAKPRRATLDEVRTTVQKALELLETNR